MCCCIAFSSSASLEHDARETLVEHSALVAGVQIVLACSEGHDIVCSLGCLVSVELEDEVTESLPVLAEGEEHSRVGLVRVVVEGELAESERVHLLQALAGASVHHHLYYLYNPSIF